MNKDLIQSSPAIEGNKSTVKPNNFALKDKQFTESGMLDKSKIELILGTDLDISNIKPKKYQKPIQKMYSIIQKHSQFYDIKDKIKNLSDKKRQLEQNNKTLKAENKKIKNTKQELNLECENISTKINDDKEIQKNLNTKTENLQNTIQKLQTDEQDLKTKTENLEQKRIKIEADTAIEKNNKETYEREQKRLKLEINKLLENKTFYSETLSGHKKETNKILYVNVGFCFILLSAMAGILYFSYTFYQDGIKHISQENSYIKMIILLSPRIGIGVLLYYIFKFLSKNLQQIVTKMYTIFTDIRDIESNLILVREITFSTGKDIEFENDEEKRNYLSFLKLSVLKNHFINLNSIKKSLHIKDEKQKLVEK